MAERSRVSIDPRGLFLQIYSLKGVVQPRVWSIQAKTLVLALLALGIASLISLLYLTQASQVATTTYDIRLMEEKFAELERENALLSYEIARLEEPSIIEARALAMGLTSTLKIEYLSLADRYEDLATRELLDQGKETEPPSLVEEDVDSEAIDFLSRWWKRLHGIGDRLRGHKSLR